VIIISKKESYRTVAHYGEDNITEKKSRFIASVKPVETEEAAVEFINEIRSKYPDARHNVYAYIIDENNISRYSDDGEPQGTAGIPVLNVLQKEKLVDTAVVVTRYFGGILLGTGGLVRAYGQAAKLGIVNAETVERTLCSVIEIKADYTLVGKIQYIISSGGYIIENTVYENDVTFTVCVKLADSDGFLKKITDNTNARAVCSIKGTKYIDL